MLSSRYAKVLNLEVLSGIVDLIVKVAITTVVSFLKTKLK